MLAHVQYHFTDVNYTSHRHLPRPSVQLPKPLQRLRLMETHQLLPRQSLKQVLRLVHLVHKSDFSDLMLPFRHAFSLYSGTTNSLATNTCDHVHKAINHPYYDFKTGDLTHRFGLFHQGGSTSKATAAALAEAVSTGGCGSVSQVGS